MAEDIKKILVSQPSSSGFPENSWPIVGRATIREETMNGAREEPRAEASRTFRFDESETIAEVRYSLVLVICFDVTVEA
jgi:hypothetical protein